MQQGVPLINRSVFYAAYIPCNFKLYRFFEHPSVKIHALRTWIFTGCFLINLHSGESLFLRKLVLGIPAQASSKNLTRPANAFGAPIRPRHLVPTQQGVGTLAPNDLPPCRMAFYFVSTFAIAQTPTKQPALRLSRTKNLHFAKATFPGFSAKERTD